MSVVHFHNEAVDVEYAVIAELLDVEIETGLGFVRFSIGELIGGERLCFNAVLAQLGIISILIEDY